MESNKKEHKSIFGGIKAYIKLIEFIIIIVLVVVIVVMGLKKMPDHRETLLSYGFKDVGELVTQEWYGRIIEDSSDDRKLFDKISIPLTKSRIVFSIDVEVLASVEFSKIDCKNEKKKSLKMIKEKKKQKL